MLIAVMWLIKRANYGHEDEHINTMCCNYIDIIQCKDIIQT